jgi:hypothetical protein
LKYRKKKRGKIGDLSTKIVGNFPDLQTQLPGCEFQNLFVDENIYLSFFNMYTICNLFAPHPRLTPRDNEMLE